MNTTGQPGPRLAPGCTPQSRKSKRDGDLSRCLVFAAFLLGSLCGLGGERVVAQPGTGTARQSAADSVAAYKARIQEQEQKLKDLRSEIQELRTRDRELVKKERSAATQLRGLEKEAALTADLLRQLETKQSRVQSQLEGIRAEHDRATEELAQRKRQLSRTLRAMYIRGTPSATEVVLRTASMRYTLSHFKYLGLVARNNQRLLEDIRAEEQYLAATDAKLTETLYEISNTADETRTEKEELAQAKRTRQSLLSRVRQQRAQYASAIEDLAASERKLKSFIAVLEKRRAAAEAAGKTVDVFPDVGFARLRGSMPWPARGRITTAYGRQKHPKHGTITFNSGIDIAAPEGADVRCVARGQVEYVQWTDGYGKTVIVNHGGGYYTVYAHLSQTMVSESQPVEPGAVLGRVGDTGSLDGVKLHFEVRAGAQGDAVDPMAWLGR